MQYQPKREKPSHLVLLEFALANPGLTHRDAAAATGLHPMTVGYIMNSDLFRKALADRMREISAAGGAEAGILSLRDRMQAAAEVAVERLASQIALSSSPDFLLSATEKLTRGLGYGSPAGRPPASTVVNVDARTVVVPASRAALAEARAALDERAGLPPP